MENKFKFKIVKCSSCKGKPLYGAVLKNPVEILDYNFKPKYLSRQTVAQKPDFGKLKVYLAKLAVEDKPLPDIYLLMFCGSSIQQFNGLLYTLKGLNKSEIITTTKYGNYSLTLFSSPSSLAEFLSRLTNLN